MSSRAGTCAPSAVATAAELSFGIRAKLGCATPKFAWGGRRDGDGARSIAVRLPNRTHEDLAPARRRVLQLFDPRHELGARLDPVDIDPEIVAQFGQKPLDLRQVEGLRGLLLQKDLGRLPGVLLDDAYRLMERSRDNSLFFGVFVEIALGRSRHKERHLAA